MDSTERDEVTADQRYRSAVLQRVQCGGGEQAFEKLDGEEEDQGLAETAFETARSQCCGARSTARTCSCSAGVRAFGGEARGCRTVSFTG